MNVKISIHHDNLDKRYDKFCSIKQISDEDKKSVKKFLNELSLGKVNRGKKVGDKRLCKYLDLLKIPLKYWDKPTSKLTIKDTEEFEKDLTTDKIKGARGVLTNNTKSNIKVALKIYFRWRFPSKAEKLVGWLDTSIPFKTPDYLSEKEILKLYKHCKNYEEKYLVAVLFDSGARAEEFMNIRYEDIQMPEGNENFVKITLKEEYSKTNGRVVSLYWTRSLEAIRDYYNERLKDDHKLNDPIFKSKYDNARRFLLRLGEKVLGKKIHFHLFRHSSATHYASKLNRQELCYRYGWTFSSDMPDVYISRSGMLNKDLDEKFENTELGELKTKLNKEEFERKKMQEEFENKVKELEELRNESVSKQDVIKLVQQALIKTTGQIKN
ncbi:hypothetical protein CMI38_02740 [Candidatus Pacearchaeota archaeon]|nr:hypothetical protein [Candidatus Pacearchaeota archaeon]|tara:strand:+ start:2003 stop:3148 length:1146 start_codon:yes stop_codon:yes gene_type:complete